MVLGRLAVLALMAFLSWEFGHIVNPNAFGEFMGMTFFLFAPTLYFLPLIEASLRKSEQRLPIGMLNLLLGWTVVGWVAAYIWALSSAVEGSRQIPPPPPAAPPPAPPEMECPHCAEIIKRAAKVCKHCGRDVTPAV